MGILQFLNKSAASQPRIPYCANMGLGCQWGDGSDFSQVSDTGAAKPAVLRNSFSGKRFALKQTTKPEMNGGTAMNGMEAALWIVSDASDCGKARPKRLAIWLRSRCRSAESVSRSLEGCRRKNAMELPNITSSGPGDLRKPVRNLVYPAEAYLGVEKVRTCLSHKGLCKRSL